MEAGEGGGGLTTGKQCINVYGKKLNNSVIGQQNKNKVSGVQRECRPIEKALMWLAGLIG